MYKVIVTTVLDPEVKAKLASYSKETYIPYGKLIEYAVKDFENRFQGKKEFKFKHIDFDRIKTKSFTTSIFTELNNVLLEYSKKLGISKRMLIREIITDYVKKLK